MFDSRFGGLIPWGSKLHIESHPNQNTIVKWSESREFTPGLSLDGVVSSKFGWCSFFKAGSATPPQVLVLDLKVSL